MRIGKVQTNLYNSSNKIGYRNSNSKNNYGYVSPNYCDLPICSPDKMLQITFGKNDNKSTKLIDKIYKNLIMALNHRDEDTINYSLEWVLKEYSGKHHKHDKELIQALKKQDSHGSAPLHSIVKYATPRIFRITLGIFKEDTDKIEALKIKDEDGNTPLHMLHENERSNGIIEHVIQTLKEQKEELKEILTTPNKKGIIPLHGLMERMDFETFSKLLDVFDNKNEEIQKALTIKDENDRTPLHRIGHKNAGKIFEKLFEVYKEQKSILKEMITKPDKTGHTFLHLIMSSINPEEFDNLLSIFEGNTDEIISALSAKDRTESTPIHSLSGNKQSGEIFYKIFELLRNNESKN